MYIEKAYTKNFDFIKYLPVPLVFFMIILLNFIMTLYMDGRTEALIQDLIARQGEMSVFVQTVAPLAAFLVLLLVWVRFVHKQSLTSLTTARNSISWKRVFTSFFIWGGISVVLTMVAYYASPESFEWNFRAEPFFKLFVVAVVLIPMQTSFEEYLFRGYLMQGIGIITKSRLFPLLFTSIVFGLMHSANPEVEKIGPMALVYYIGTGLFLGVLKLMDEGMELALGFHAANNLVACLLVTSDWTALQTPSVLKDISAPAAGIDVLAPVFVFYPLLLLLFSKLYGWKNWRTQLAGNLSLPDKRTLTH